MRSEQSSQQAHKFEDNWRQVFINKCSDTSKALEQTEPLLDPLIRQAALLYLSEDGYLQQSGAGTRQKSMLSELFNPSSISSYRRLYSRAAFVPTCGLEYLQNIQLQLPRHSLILADYDSLIESSTHGLQSSSEGEDGSLDAYNAPIVSSSDDQGASIDHLSYLVQPHNLKLELQFPTDFDALQRMYTGITMKPCVVMKQTEFLQRYCPDVSATRTKLGFNPMVTDFSNMSFLLSTSN